MRNKPRWGRLRLTEQMQFSAFVPVPIHLCGASFERGWQNPQAQTTEYSKPSEMAAHRFCRLEFSPEFQQGDFV